MWDTLRYYAKPQRWMWWRPLPCIPLQTRRWQVSLCVDGGVGGSCRIQGGSWTSHSLSPRAKCARSEYLHDLVTTSGILKKCPGEHTCGEYVLDSSDGKESYKPRPDLVGIQSYWLLCFGIPFNLELSTRNCDTPKLEAKGWDDH
jgi:hypothetical protein